MTSISTLFTIFIEFSLSLVYVPVIISKKEAISAKIKIENMRSTRLYKISNYHHHDNWHSPLFGIVKINLSKLISSDLFTAVLSLDLFRSYLMNSINTLTSSSLAECFSTRDQTFLDLLSIFHRYDKLVELTFDDLILLKLNFSADQSRNLLFVYFLVFFSSSLPS